MKKLDQKILNNFDSKLDKSSQREAISKSIRKIGIQKTALETGKEKKQISSFEIDVYENFKQRSRDGNDFLNEYLDDVERNFKEEGKEIHLSKAYFMFWERIERSNFLLETLIHRKFKYTQIELNKLLDSWLSKKGDWNSYSFISNKYGFLPNQFMQNSEITIDPKRLDDLIKLKLKQCAALLIRMFDGKFDEGFIYTKKNKSLSDIYNMLSYSLGNPKKYASNIIKPMESKTIDKFCVVNFPCSNLDTKHFYTSYFSKISVEQPNIKYLNLEMKDIEKLIKDQLISGFPVTIGTEMIAPEISNLFDEMYDLNETMATCLDLDKGKRINYGIAKIEKISRIVGLNEVSESSKNWKVSIDKRIISVDSFWLKENAYKFMINKDIILNKFPNADEYLISEIPSTNPLGELL